MILSAALDSFGHNNPKGWATIMSNNLAHTGLNSSGAATRIPAPGKYATRYRLHRHIFIIWNADTMKRLYAEKKPIAKAIANDANVSVRTAEGYLAERHPPGGLALVHLMANNPAYEAELRRLRQMEADLDPEFERAVLAVMNRQARGGQG